MGGWLVDYSAYYFGCVDNIGHYFWNTEGQRLSLVLPADLGLPWEHVDQNLLPKKPRNQGDGLFHMKDRWVALSVHDYTVDSRPGSHSTFFLRGGYRNVTMMLEELRLYPFFAKILDRIGEMHIILEVE
jgi:hypothetical protein